jgi:hypothetical protein
MYVTGSGSSELTAKFLCVPVCCVFCFFVLTVVFERSGVKFRLMFTEDLKSTE